MVGLLGGGQGLDGHRIVLTTMLLSLLTPATRVKAETRIQLRGGLWLIVAQNEKDLTQLTREIIASDPVRDLEKCMIQLCLHTPPPNLTS